MPIIGASWRGTTGGSRFALCLAAGATSLRPRLPRVEAVLLPATRNAEVSMMCSFAPNVAAARRPSPGTKVERTWPSPRGVNVDATSGTGDLRRPTRLLPVVLARGGGGARGTWL